MKSFVVTGACFAAVFGGCASAVAPSDAGRSEAPAPRGGLLANRCGAADGPAYTLIIADDPSIACPMNGEPDRPIPSGSVYFMVDGPAPTDPVTQTVPGHLACDAAMCPIQGEGTITFSQISPTASQAIGTYSLVLPDGRRLEGAFAVPLCHNRTLCF